MRATLGSYFHESTVALRQLDFQCVAGLRDGILSAFDDGRTVFLCGNGGSGTSASHIVQDLGKSLIPFDRINDPTQQRLRIICLNDNLAYLLAWANDYGYAYVFLEQLKNLAKPGDLFIGLSGSGNSENVLLATEWANEAGLLTWGVTGFDGGKLRSLAMHSIHVEAADMGIVESAHLLLFHWVINDLASVIRDRNHVASAESNGICQESKAAGV